MKLKILLFILLFIGLFHPACIYDKEETYFPEDYDLSYDKFQQESIISVKDLCLNDTDFQQPLLPDSFGTASTYFSNANKASNDIREKSKDLLLDVANAIRDECIGKEENLTIKENLLTMCEVILNVPCLAVCAMSIIVYESKAQEIINSMNEPLTKSNKGLNAILKEIYTKRRELYCEGGGYENYSGLGKNYYLRTENFFRLFEMQIQGDYNPPFDERKISSFLRDANEMKNYNFENCRFPRYINNVSNAALYLYSVYKDLENGINAMQNEYTTLRDGVNGKRGEISLQLNKLKGEEIDTITYNDISNILKARYAQDIIFDPSKEIQEIEENLSQIGGIDSKIKEAKEIYEEKGDFYVARAIENLKEVDRELDGIVSNINEINYQIDYVLNFLEKNVSDEKSLTEQILSNYSVSGVVDANLLKVAMEEKEKADKLLQVTKKGSKIKNYRMAIDKYAEVRNILSDYNKYIAGLKDKLNKKIQFAENLIARANRDEIDTYFESGVLNDTKARIAYLKNQSEIFESISLIDSTIQSIYTSADLKYGYLNEMRTNLSEKLRLVSEIMDVSNYRKTIEKFNVYLKDGKFYPEKTIGNYKEILSTFTEMDERLSSNILPALKEYLVKKVKITNVFSPPYSDEETEITTFLEIKNDLSFGTNGTFSIEIPKTKKGMFINSLSELYTDLKYVYDSDGGILKIYFNGIKPNSTYSIMVKSKEKILKSSEEKRGIKFYENKLEETVSTTIESQSYPMKGYYRTKTVGDFCKSYLNGREVQSHVSDGEVVVDLEMNGRSALSISCIKYDPFTFISSNHSMTYDGKEKVEYILNVKSNIGNVYDAEIVRKISGDIIKNSISVSDSAGNLPKGFVVNYYPGYTIVRWKVDILTDDYQTFIISYEINDKERYLIDLVNQLANESERNNINISDSIERANSYILYKDYSKALKEIELAKEKLDKERNLRIQREGINEKIKELEQFGNSTFIEAFSNYPEIYTEFSKMKNKFYESLDQTKKLLEENRTAEAIASLKNLEKQAYTQSLDNEIYRQQEKLLKKISNLKKYFLDFGKISNSSDEVSKTEELEEDLKKLSYLVGNKNYSEISRIMENVSAEIKNLEKRKEEIEENLKLDISNFIKDINKAIDKWKETKESFEKAFTLSNNSPVKLLYSPESKINETERLIESLQNFKEKYEKLKSFDAEELDRYKEIYSNVNKKIESTEKEIEKIKKNYEDSLSSVKEALDEKIKNEGESKDTIYLQSLLGKASGYASDGRYLDSLSYIAHARQLMSTKKQLDWTLPFVALVAVCAAALLIFYFKKKEKKLRIVEKL